ncbi:MAG: histidine phosphatase family protein [Aggregatilineales bacterium]
MTTLWLIRHGETAWNVEKRFQGGMDQPLNTVGEAQAQKLVPRLQAEHFDAIYASDLTRVLQTAHHAGYPIERLQKDARMREISFGIFEGLTWEEILVEHPELSAEWVKDRSRNQHGGDSLDMVAERVSAFLAYVLETHPKERVLIFAHGGTLAIMITILLGVPTNKWWQFRLDNTSISILEKATHGAYLHRYNDLSHL